MPKSTKANRAEYERRVNRIYSLLIDGLTRAEIFQYVASQGEKDPAKAWNLSERQIDNLIAVANAHLKEAAETDRQYELGKVKRRLESLYQRNLKVQDFKSAHSVLQTQIKLLRLDAPEPPATPPAVASIADLLPLLAQAIGAAQLLPTDPPALSALARLVASAAKTIEVSELAQRLATLEERLK